MGRPERSIDELRGPLGDFARALRDLRKEAGSPSYRVMAQRSHFAASTLSTAAAGERLPALDVVLAYVRACGGEEKPWQQRWHRLDALVNGRDGDSASRSTLRFGDMTPELIIALVAVLILIWSNRRKG